MITNLLKRTNIYKNHEHFRQIARVALWVAWKKYDPERGPFTPYAYRCMQTTIYSELKNENTFSDHEITYEHDKLTATAQYYELKNQQHHEQSELLTTLKNLLNEKEVQLLVDIYFNGYSYEELSEKYGISFHAFKKRRDRLIQKIRKLLKES